MNNHFRLSLHRTKSGGLLARVRRIIRGNVRVDLVRFPPGTTQQQCLRAVADKLEISTGG